MIRVRFACSPAAHLTVGAARVALGESAVCPAGTAGKCCCALTIPTANVASRNTPRQSGRICTGWGIVPDSVLRQSERGALYTDAAERLKHAGRLYPCFESDEELRAKRDYRLKRGQPAVYDRAMLQLTSQQRATAEAGGKRPHWRFLLSDSTVRWQDAVLGPREVKLPSVSDPVALLADGTPTRLFASAVDDLALEVSHVIRGEEHAVGTAVQLDLTRRARRPPGGDQLCPPAAAG